MHNIGSRIEGLLLDSGVPKRQVRRTLAELCGISQQAVALWFSGDTKRINPEYLEKIARAYSVDLHWLITGNKARLEPVAVTGVVPLVSWVAAGGWNEVTDPYTTGDAEKWLPCPVRHGNRTFVLRVRGESMFNPAGRPSFADGDLIFVDPDAQPLHKSLVVVKLDDCQEATFKQLHIEGGKRYLKALNPSWPDQFIPINGEATICGVVIFTGTEL